MVADLAALPLGRRGPGAVFRVGVAGDRAATVHHGDELVSSLQESETFGFQSGSIRQPMGNSNMTKQFAALILGLLFCSDLIAQELDQRLRRLDRNQDGKLSKEEFPADRLSLFDKLDANGDGFVTSEEQQRSLSKKRPKKDKDRTAAVPDTVRVERDVPYADTDNPRQRLDLYLPKQASPDKKLPLVVYIHGGGWHSGDKSGGYRHIGSLVESGEYIGASIGYRLTQEAIWPAQIHDCKAAIRWLRANAGKYGYDPERIGIIGTSAGGHLVAMLGTSGDVKSLEGSLGSHQDVSSRVACVVDFFGASDLTALGSRHDGPDSPPAKLIGGEIKENLDIARNASPITYVSEDDPPFIFIHGTDDPLVPYSQSEVLDAALKKVKVESLLIPVVGGGHGVSGSTEPQDRMKAFFDKHLLGKPVAVSAEPIKAVRGK